MDQSIFNDLLLLLGASFLALSLFMGNIANMRFLLAVASITFLLYGFTIDSPTIIACCFIFLAINGYFLAQLPIAFRKSQMPGKLKDIFGMYKNYISSEDFIRIMEDSEYKTYMKESLVDEGESVHRLILIVTGHVEIFKGESLISTLGPGNFVGEIGILTGKTSQATVKCKGIVEIAFWNKAYVQHESKLKQLISLNLIEKLIHPHVQDELEQ